MKTELKTQSPLLDKMVDTMENGQSTIAHQSNITAKLGGRTAKKTLSDEIGTPPSLSRASTMARIASISM